MGPIDELISGYLNNALSQEELHYFLEIIRDKEYEQKLKDKISEQLQSESVTEHADKTKEEIIFNNIMLLANTEEKIKKDIEIFQPFLKLDEQK